MSTASLPCPPISPLVYQRGFANTPASTVAAARELGAHSSHRHATASLRCLGRSQKCSARASRPRLYGMRDGEEKKTPSDLGSLRAVMARDLGGLSVVVRKTRKRDSSTRAHSLLCVCVSVCVCRELYRKQTLLTTHAHAVFRRSPAGTISLEDIYSSPPLP
jgi:hypothetical protein